MMKVRAFFIVIVIGACVTFLNACDTRKAAIEKAKQKFKVSEEQMKEQAQNRQKVLEQINTYYQDFGIYPVTLDELKGAGYDFPAEPNAGWQWLYRVTEVGPELAAEPRPQK